MHHAAKKFCGPHLMLSGTSISSTAKAGFRGSKSPEPKDHWEVWVAALRVFSLDWMGQASDLPDISEKV
jgi:hypothetical protein